MFASVEAITPFYINGKNRDDGYVVRGYPNKWYTAEEWGNSNEEIKANAKHYAKQFAITFCPKDTNKTCLIEVLEIGNEPWGIPGKEAYHAISRGFVEALKEYYGTDDIQKWRMQLSSAAFQADDIASNLNDYVEEMIPADVIPYLSYINIHPYAFSPENGKITEHPESEIGGFLRLKNLEEWRRLKAPHTKLSVTEFGWNTKTPYAGNPGVGEIAQAFYLVRAILLMSRYGVDKSFIYELLDMPGVDLFNSTGLFEQGLKPKKSFFTLEKFLTQFGDLHFIKALLEENHENGTCAYLLGNDQNEPSHLVVWNSVNINNSTNFPPFLTPQELQLPSCIEIAPDANYTYLSWDNSNDGKVSDDFIVQIPENDKQNITVLASAAPLIIPLTNYGCKYNIDGELESIDLREDCQNITKASTLAGNEQQCKAFDPEVITIPQIANGGMGRLEYIWQKSVTGPDSGWSAIAQATAWEYDPPLLNQSTWFRRLEKREDCTEYLATNVIEKRINAELCPPDELVISQQEDLVFESDAFGKAWVFWPAIKATSNCPNNQDNCVIDNQQLIKITAKNDTSYLLNIIPTSWQEAKNICHSIDAKLVNIQSNEENQLLEQALETFNVEKAFIGLSDEIRDGTYRWDGNENHDFNLWSANAIAKIGQVDYAYLSTEENGYWLLTDSSGIHPSICELTCQDNPVRVIQSKGPENGSWLSIGQYEVIYYAFDDCGNFQRTSFKVTVNPSEMPICEQEVPEDYYDLGIYELSRYLTSKEKVEWLEAKYACEAENGYLAIITSTSENEWLAQQLREPRH